MITNKEQKDMENKNSNEIMVQYEVEGEKIKLTPSIVQQYIVGDSGKITLPEFKFFTELCKARKLNPYLKEVFCLKYGNQPAQLVVSKDVLLKRAVLHPEYNGMEDGIIVIDEKGVMTERQGCFFLPNETIVGGWARVYRKDWERPIYCSVSFNEVAGKKKDGNLNSNWASKPATMVNKVAKARALRETFVEEFAGIYDESEMPLPELKENIKEVETEVIVQEEPKEETVVSLDEI